MDQILSRGMKDEFIIDIKELFWRILEQWKAIIAFAIIIAILFSGMTYVKSGFSGQDEKNQRTYGEILSELDPADREAVLSVIKEKDTLDAFQRYISESPFMNLDPFNVPSLSMTWVVNSENSINKQLAALYINEMSSSDIVDSINEAWDFRYESEQVKELLIAETEISLETEDNMDSNVLKLTLYIPDGEDSEKAKEAIEAVIPQITAKLYSKVGEHTLSFISGNTQIISDPTMADAQYNIYNRLNSLINQFTTFKNNLTAGQKSIYEELSAVKETETEVPENIEPVDEAPGRSVLSKRNLLIGFILGGLLYCGIYLLYFVFSGRVFSLSVLEQSFGVRSLCEWHTKKAKGILQFLTNDALIYKKRHKGHLDMEAEIERITESVVNHFKEKEKAKLLLACNNNISDNTEKFTQALIRKLNENNVSVYEGKVNIKEGLSLGENAVSDNDTVAMVMDSKHSGVKDVKDVLNKCQYCNKPFLGVAYLDC